MCVNLGIKPRVHYHSGYPCQDIADLFESEVDINARCHVDAPVHRELPADAPRGKDKRSCSIVERTAAPGGSHAGHARAVVAPDQLPSWRDSAVTRSPWRKTCWLSEMAER